MAKHFACKDVGYDCTWSLEGESEEEMLPKIEEHAKDVHNLTYFKDEAVQHAKDVHNLTYFKDEAVQHVLEAIRKNG